MKVYQIHEHYGEYEDFVNRIVATYLDERKAQIDLKRRTSQVEKEEKQAEKCNNCSWYTADRIPSCTYCEKFVENPETGDCINYVSDYYFPSYELKEETILDVL